MLLIDVEWRSELDGSPGGFMLSLWIEAGWIVELTVVVLGVEGGLRVLAHLDEVGNILSVGEVFVEVVLEVLDQVHVLLNKVVSSNSWESEGTIIKLPSVYGDLWVLTELLKFIIDFHGVIVALSVEASREIVQLNVERVFGNFKSIVTWDLSIYLLSVLDLDSLSSGNETDKG